MAVTPMCGVVDRCKEQSNAHVDATNMEAFVTISILTNRGLSVGNLCHYRGKRSLFDCLVVCSSHILTLSLVTTSTGLGCGHSHEAIPKQPAGNKFFIKYQGS